MKQSEVSKAYNAVTDFLHKHEVPLQGMSSYTSRESWVAFAPLKVLNERVEQILSKFNVEYTFRVDTYTITEKTPQ